jgi:hypothetical protein
MDQDVVGANGPTMTPKLKLKDEARKPLLSRMLKCFWLGILRTSTSMHMILAPSRQAVTASALVGKE